MKNKYLPLVSFLLMSCGIGFAQTTVTFNYTGSAQTWVVPPCVTKVTVTVNGAAGGTGGETSNNSQDIGGDGGSVVGVLNVTTGTTLNIYVGGQGEDGTPSNGGGTGGWNGGGFGLQGYYPPPPWLWFAGGGGGASDIRVGGTALANRVVVGGGGGGAGFNYFACCNYDRGGPGGGLTGQSGWSGNVQGSGGSGTGGTQAAGGIGGSWGGYCTCSNGTLGIGSNDCVSSTGNSGGGGGGGYYGGGAGCWSGGGGGSSYVGGLASVTTNSQGIQAGNGIVIIKYTGGGALLTLNIPPPTNPSCNNCNGSATVNTIGGTAPFTYSWAPGGQTNQTATGLCAGTYRVTVTDVCGDIATDSVTLTANPVVPVATVTNVKCNGQSTGGVNVSVTGGTPPYTYSWTPNVSNTNSASNLSAGTYTILVTDINACTASVSAIITQPTLLTANVTPTGALCNGVANGSALAVAAGGTGPYGYVWSPGGNTNATGTGLPAGTYTMTITDANGCTATAAGTVTQPTAINVNVTGPQLICVGSTGTLTATVTGGIAPYAYSWSSGIASTTSTASITPVSTQTYTVTVTDANGCSATGDVTVQFGGPPISIAITGSPSMCSGLQTSLCATVTGGTGGNSFLWQPGNVTTPCFTISPSATTIYTVSVTDNCGRTATTTTTVHVNPLPAVDFSASLYQGCAPLCTQFYSSTTLGSGGQAQYVWTFGDGDTSHVQSPVYCYSASGTYDVTLTVTSDSGCSSTLKKVSMITAFVRPKAAFSLSPQPTTIMSPTIQFTDKSTGQYNMIFWLWNFGDESNLTSNLQNPSHTYQDTGNYCASLVVMDSHGCADTATNCLVIDPSFNLFIPSGFTPNGDGKNDVFQPRGQYIKSFEMYIFNRWGTEVYHTNSINQGWDGSISGGAIGPEDTYEYKILVTDTKNKQHSYVGQINLIK